ncbi:MAG: hypothetical protein QXE79_06595 [Candidatus Bathyarchaeia archaeon]
MALTDYIASLIRELLANLQSSISSIPFSISIGDALILTVIYIASLVSSTLIKMLLVSVWILALATFFFPTLIPEEYEAASLILLASIFAIVAVIIKFRSKRLGRTRIDNASSEIIKWMRERNIINPETGPDDPFIKYKLKEILRKNKLY